MADSRFETTLEGALRAAIAVAVRARLAVSVVFAAALAALAASVEPERRRNEASAASAVTEAGAHSGSREATGATVRRIVRILIGGAERLDDGIECRGRYREIIRRDGAIDRFAHGGQGGIDAFLGGDSFRGEFCTIGTVFGGLNPL